MPIPTKDATETKKSFLDRCMSDVGMTAEFPDEDQRMSICSAQIPKKQGDNFSSKGLPVEIFAVGRWNGMAFTLMDLKSIAATFNELREVHAVPLKFGHNDQQPFTDGQPSLGWVREVYVSEGKDGTPKLMATFSDMPELVYNSIKAGLYRKVSIELDLDVEHKGKKFNYVLSGVALLGADIPAVNTLADLTAYMSRDSLVTSQKRLSFTAIGNPDKEDDMSDELKAQIAALEASNKALEADNTGLKSNAEKFAKEAADQKAKDEAKKVTDRRTEVVALFEKAVTDEKILPAQRDNFAKALRIDDDVAVMAIDDATVNSLIDSVGGISKKFGKDTSKSTDQNVSEDPGTALTEKAHEIQATNPGWSFSKALNLAMKGNTKLAQAHFDDTQEAG